MTTTNGQRIYFAGSIIFSGLCPYCHGEGCRSSNCYTGEIFAVDRIQQDATAAFVAALKYASQDTARELGRQAATAARQELQSMGVTAWLPTPPPTDDPLAWPLIPVRDTPQQIDRRGAKTAFRAEMNRARRIR